MSNRNLSIQAVSGKYLNLFDSFLMYPALAHYTQTLLTLLPHS